MTDERDDDIVFPPALFAEQLRRASEDLTTQQLEWYENLVTGGRPGGDRLDTLRAIGTDAAVFKTHVQSGGRISIPDAEREALDIEDGDLVQAFVLPLETGDTDE